MNRLVWKLLRQHISVGQLTGFFLANLFGTMIVLLSIQFYQDVLSVFTQGDGFVKKEYIIATKKISTLGNLTGKGNTFSPKDIEEVKEQPFTENVGVFTPSLFKVSAGLSMQKTGIHLSTEMFFESVPDECVDVNLDKWLFDKEARVIPIIIPHNYLNLYNSGFVQNRSLPRLSEGLISMIQMDITLHGNGRVEQFKGQIAGFSNRLNTILVPQALMDWTDMSFAPGKVAHPSRPIVEVKSPTDTAVSDYFRQKHYETEGDSLDAGKTTYFLRLITGIVMGVRLFIRILSFYTLMLSIFLLLRKNTVRLENLLLIGYTPKQITFPYNILAVSLNLSVLTLSVGGVTQLHSYHTEIISTLFPQVETGTLLPCRIVGCTLFLAASLLSIILIHRKIASIWKGRQTYRY